LWFKNKKSREHRNLPTAFNEIDCINPAGLRADPTSLVAPPPPDQETFVAHSPSFKNNVFFTTVRGKLSRIFLTSPGNLDPSCLEIEQA
jgi:hypothetical protein